MTAPDIFYPSWLTGRWSASSTTTSVTAPCSIALFGGQRLYERAVAEIGSSLEYECRFVPYEGGAVADRAFNVESIARASMGTLSVDQIDATPNKIHSVLKPKDSGGRFTVDILIEGRTTETIGSTFVTDEIGTNVLKSEFKDQANLVSLKRVETISSYELVENGLVMGKQKTITFLEPSNDPTSRETTFFMMSNGRAVDVRTYDVVYRQKER